MIETIHIENYKSIQSLDLELGRVTVLIGENGSGKSNILEAIAFAAAASQDKLDNEFLVSRGIRVSKPEFIKSAFLHNTTHSDENDANILIRIDIGKQAILYNIKSQNEIYHKWEITKLLDPLPESSPELDQILNKLYALQGEKIDGDLMPEKLKNIILNTYEEFELQTNILNYLIFSPENSSLRLFEEEAQIEPLGIKGEGLYKLLKVTSSTEPKKIDVIKKYLRLISWFKDFELPETKFGNFEILIRDKYIEEIENEFYNHKSTNEGFLFLLFYILLLVSDKTPHFFAIDNIDASLNPKLCTKLTETVVELAKKYNKQVILTTHNPAVLDGLNLYDDEQKILVVSRKTSGHTKVKKLKPPRVEEGEIPIKLSEAFLNGMIGGLPKTF